MEVQICNLALGVLSSSDRLSFTLIVTFDDVLIRDEKRKRLMLGWVGDCYFLECYCLNKSYCYCYCWLEDGQHYQCLAPPAADLGAHQLALSASSPYSGDHRRTFGPAAFSRGTACPYRQPQKTHCPSSPQHRKGHLLSNSRGSVRLPAAPVQLRNPHLHLIHWRYTWKRGGGEGWATFSFSLPMHSHP